MKRSLLLLLLIFVSFSAFGDDFSTIFGDVSEFFENTDTNTGLTIFPILMIPLGGKYAGMGTAYTAIADDAGFLESNNPFKNVTFLAFNGLINHRLRGRISQFILGVNRTILELSPNILWLQSPQTNASLYFKRRTK